MNEMTSAKVAPSAQVPASNSRRRTGRVSPESGAAKLKRVLSEPQIVARVRFHRS
jgi:hypothetical protein